MLVMSRWCNQPLGMLPIKTKDCLLVAAFAIAFLTSISAFFIGALIRTNSFPLVPPDATYRTYFGNAMMIGGVFTMLLTLGLINNIEQKYKKPLP